MPFQKTFNGLHSASSCFLQFWQYPEITQSTATGSTTNVTIEVTITITHASENIACTMFNVEIDWSNQTADEIKALIKASRQIKDKHHWSN